MCEHVNWLSFNAPVACAISDQLRACFADRFETCWCSSAEHAALKMLNITLITITVFISSIYRQNC